MEWATPQYDRTQVNVAGRTLINPGVADDDRERAFEVINNWRSSHNFPLNTFQVTLRNKARHIDSDCLVAQRIKRLSSIFLKLKRFSSMKLSQMQDIGGCRAIVRNVKSVDALVLDYEKGNLKHKRASKDDYIRQPQSSGYRGVHLVYRYYSDKKSTFNELKIEMQFRSTYQHAWATAVETVGTFIRQALKSSQGEEDWLRFFALMGTAMAFRERSPPVPNTPTERKALVAELRSYAAKLNVTDRLEAYGAALQTLEQQSAEDAHFYLLNLDATEKKVTITGFKANELEDANKKYLELERSIMDRAATDAVLVSVDSLASLRRAYPNYFLDTKVFIGLLEDALSK